MIMMKMAIQDDRYTIWVDGHILKTSACVQDNLKLIGHNLIK